MNKHDFNHVSGGILGGAMGDTFGIPVKFKRWAKILDTYGKQGLTEFRYDKETGLSRFSGDTTQTVFTADGLLKSVLKFGYEAPLSMEMVHRSYRDWYFVCVEDCHRNHGWITQWDGFRGARGGGKTCINALSGDRMGTFDSPLNDSPTCGGVMRSAPCGLVYWEDTERAFQTACECAVITHGHPDAYLPAGVYAAIIAELIQGKELSDAVSNAVRILKTRPNYLNTLAKINQAIHLLSQPTPPREAITEIGLGNLGTECIALGIYCALKTPDDFRQTLINAVNHSGNSNTVGSVSGTILGAYLGQDAIPTQWLEHLRLKSELEMLSRDIITIPTATDKTEFLQRYPV